jgi:hypothetical protein
MALNKPFGLSPVMTMDANTFSSRSTRYRIPSSDGVIYSIGDAIKGVIGADANGVPNVVKAAGTETTPAGVRGVIIGVENPSVNVPSLQGVVLDQTITSIPATKTRDYYVYVVDDPGVALMVQDDGITGGNLVANSANKNFSLTVANPAQPYQLSASVILSSSLATTNTLTFKAVGLAQYPSLPGGSANGFGAFAIWVCRINEHEFMGNMSGM